MARVVAKATIDHDVIKRWCEERNLEAQDLGASSWEEFFHDFEERELAFVYQDRVDGRRARSYRLIPRDEADIDAKELVENAEMRSPSEELGAIELLKRDHRMVNELFEALEPDDSEGDSSSIVSRLIVMLEAHARIEEEIFYPAVRDSTASSARMIARATEDHEVMHDLIDDLRALNGDARELNATMRELIDVVRAHVAIEEAEIFPDVMRGLDEVDLRRIGREMSELRDEIGAPTTMMRTLDIEA